MEDDIKKMLIDKGWQVDYKCGMYHPSMFFWPGLESTLWAILVDIVDVNFLVCQIYLNGRSVAYIRADTLDELESRLKEKLAQLISPLMVFQTEYFGEKAEANETNSST